MKTPRVQDNRWRAVSMSKLLPVTVRLPEMARTLLRCSFLAGLLLCSGVAVALDFRSVADAAAILYDAPSTKAQKLFVLSRDYPVEVVVKLEGWTKVRDDTGEFAWIENHQLSERRTVLVKSSGAEARHSASDAAALAFTAEKGVVLELLQVTAGWVKARHPDGAVGFIKVSQLWGV
jgi:SH3-like domain-containing protein